MRTISVLALLIGVAACSDDAGDEPGVPNEVNECATPHATYLQSCSERASGTCGPIQDVLVNIDDPAITSPRCDSITQENCIARASNCRTQHDVDGYTCNRKETYVTTFQPDGSSATAISTIWIECNEGSSCSSTYDCTLTRQ